MINGVCDNVQDEFSEYYADFLNGSYDCVDRLILNGYYGLAQTPGGFRLWWRHLMGNEDTLDTTHLMRMAGRFSRRVRAHAKAHQIPLLDCHTGERKHKIAAQYLPQDPNFVGVFLILVGRAPASVWDVRRTKSGKGLRLTRKTAWVNHYAFHIVDREWGHLIIKLCGHPPFTAQLIFNGHEYVARQARKEELAFTKEGNCFTHVSDATRLAQIADTLCSSNMIGQLSQVCERWIYSACLCFALNLAEQERSGFRYAYSIYQEEYSRNLLFRRGGEMEQIFQGVVDRTRRHLNVKTLKTIFGTRKRPFRHQGHPPPRCEIVIERPTYDLTVINIYFGKISAKIYTKGDHVLRIEITVHNARVLRCGVSIAKLSQIVSRLKEILTRFLNSLRCLDVTSIGGTELDQLPAPTQVGQTRVGGINLHQPRMRAVLEGVMALAPAPQGFHCADLLAKVQAVSTVHGNTYTPRQAAYDLKKLRGKNIVRKIEGSRRYEVMLPGLQTAAAALLLREKVILPVLAGAGKPRRGRPPQPQDPTDVHYQILQHEMYALFQTIGIAV